MKRNFACLAFICLFIACSQAQTKTIKGNYCGNLSGNRAGEIGFRVGSAVRIFQMNFGQEKRGSNAKMIGFNINKVKVGDEFIVKYNVYEFIVTITGTGKKRKIEPCTLG